MVAKVLVTHYFWINLNQDINLGLVFILITLALMGKSLRKRVITYLESKAEGSKSMMDEAHLFLLDALRLNQICSCTIRILKLTLAFDRYQHEIGLVLAIMKHTFVMTLFLAALIDVSVQFIMVMRPSLISEFRFSDRTVFVIIKTVIIVSQFIITATFAAFGQRGEVYYVWMDKEDVVPVDELFIFRHVMIFTCLTIPVILRLVLKIQYDRDGSLPSKQLISNKALALTLPFHIGVAIAKLSVTNKEALQILRDLHLFGGPVFAMTALIVMHKELRSQSAAQIKKSWMVFSKQFQSILKWPFKPRVASNIEDLEMNAVSVHDNPS